MNWQGLKATSAERHGPHMLEYVLLSALLGGNGAGEGSMIRIRFHGRGGHGIKTASRIVGSAAFLAGYQAQDSPYYGAERRGASITAFTRIDQAPILERGHIERPDLIVVGDETLLEDPTAGVLAGQETSAAVFVNADEREAAALTGRYQIRAPLVALDVTERTLKTIGKASALSAGLGAAAARLVGVIPEHRLIEAVLEELRPLALSPELMDKNVAVARQVFGALAAVELRGVETPAPGRVQAIRYEGPARGTPSIVRAGNAVERHTGSWRVERPEIDYDRCTRCGICFVRCPDGAIALDDQGYPIIDYDHCKGCMICWEECPVGGIEKKKEIRAW